MSLIKAFVDSTATVKYVDPLSLYLSLKGTEDERVEMACEQIIERYQ